MAEQVDPRQRLAEAEAILDAMRRGEVDAIVGSSQLMLVRMREAEAALRESREQFKAIIEQLPVGIGATDSEGRFIIRNSLMRHAVLDFIPSRTADPGTQWLSLDGHGQPVPEDQWPGARALRGENTSPGMEFVYSEPDGTQSNRLVTAAPFRNSEGRLIGAIVVEQDITARKRAEAELRLADQRKDEFLAVLAHELRNPLAPLRNGLELMRIANGDIAASNEARAMMERQVGHLVRLIDDLLDTSRIASGKLELRKRPMDVVEAVGVALETSRPLLASAQHEVRVRLPDEPLVVEGDPVRLAQVFSNLLNNAARYTGARGHVGIEARVEGHEVMVAVEDDGRGIPEEMLERVFEPFMQVDSGATRMHGGLGLGLALARRLVELHGGSIHAESAGTGRGSRFVVRLPAAPDVLVSSPGSPDSGDRIEGLRTLVVDDNDDGARSLAMLLETMGHDVRVANDGESALRTATVSHPDLVILDIGMPGMDGYEVARRLRAASASSPMTIIALSGYGQVADRERSREAGIDAHVVKPLDPAALEALIAALRAATSPDTRGR